MSISEWRNFSGSANCPGGVRRFATKDFVFSGNVSKSEISDALGIFPESTARAIWLPIVPHPIKPTLLHGIGCHQKWERKDFYLPSAAALWFLLTWQSLLFKAFDKIILVSQFCHRA
jgi:hypothetical protein